MFDKPKKHFFKCFCRRFFVKQIRSSLSNAEKTLFLNNVFGYVLFQSFAP